MRGGVLGKFRQNPVRRPSRMNLVFLSEGGASKIENRDPKTDTFFSTQHGHELFATPVYP